MHAIQQVEPVANSVRNSRRHRDFSIVRPPRDTRESKISWLASLLVGDVMTHPAICVAPETQLPEARLLMKERGIRRLPVVDGDQLVGILTVGDVRGAWASEVSTLNRSELDYLMHHVKVERVMTHAPITVAPDTRLVDAARLMAAHKIGGLPVVSGAGQVVGIVTESDIFRTLVELIEIDSDLPSAIDPDRNGLETAKESP